MAQILDYNRDAPGVEKVGDSVVIRTSAARVSILKTALWSVMAIVAFVAILLAVAALFTTGFEFARVTIVAPACIGVVLGMIAWDGLSHLGERLRFEVTPDDLRVIAKAFLQTVTYDWKRADLTHVILFETGTNFRGTRMFDLRIVSRNGPVEQFMVGRPQAEIDQLAVQLCEALGMPLERTAGIARRS